MSSGILQILNDLKDISGRNDKIEKIASLKTDHLFSKVLNAALNPKIRYFMDAIPKVKPEVKKKVVETSVFDDDDVQQPVDLNSAIDGLIENLASRKLTGNAAKAYVIDLLESLPVDDREVISRIIKADLRCGVKAATVNTAFGYEYIYIHPNLLCSPYKRENVDKLFKKNKYVILQLKSDGARCQILVTNHSVIAYTREGNLLNFRGKLDYLTEIHDLHGWVIDGELLTRTNGLVDPRQTCNGIINTLITDTITDENLEKVFMTAWDMFPIENMTAKSKYDVPYEQRFEQLKSVCHQIQTNFFVPSKTEIVKSFEEAEVIFTAWMEAGEEGGIFKSPDLPWSDTRSPNAIKIKGDKEGDFEIIGYEYGEVGKQFEHGLGGLIVATRDRKLVTKIGKGFKEDERLNFFGYENPDDLIGKIVLCGYTSITKAKDKDTYALFLEKFKGFRLDKTEANSFDELDM